MPEAEIVKTPQPTAPKPFDWPKVISAAVLGLGLLAGAAYAGYWYGTESAKLPPEADQTSKPPAASQPTPKPTPTPIPTPIPTPLVEDETKNWGAFSNPKGYSMRYPKQFFLEKREEGFYVLLEDPQNPMSVAFYLDDRGKKTLSERREGVGANLVNPVFSDLGSSGIDGFVVAGTVGPGYGEGIYVKAAYIDFRGKELIFGCEGAFCNSDLFDQILSTFKFLD